MTDKNVETYYFLNREGDFIAENLTPLVGTGVNLLKIGNGVIHFSLLPSYNHGRHCDRVS